VLAEAEKQKYINFIWGLFHHLSLCKGSLSISCLMTFIYISFVVSTSLLWVLFAVFVFWEFILYSLLLYRCFPFKFALIKVMYNAFL